MDDDFLDDPADRACEPVSRNALRGLRVLLAAPGSHPAGGMSVQADTFAARLRDEGAVVRRIVTNPQAPLILQPMVPVADAWRRHRFTGRLHDSIVEGADVLVVHGASWNYFREVVAPSLHECRDAGIRTVLRWDGGDADRYFAGNADEVRANLVCADEIVVQSGFLADVFATRLGRRPRVIPNLVLTPNEDRPPVRHDGPLRILCTRHLTKPYGVDLVIRAVASAAARGADVALAVAGDGPERTALETAARASLGHRVGFLGAVPHERVLSLLAESDIVVNGSWVDNFPVSLAEALAAGVPVATTDAGGIRWVVQHGRTGLVTPCGDADALAGSIVSLATDRALLEDLGWRAKVEALRWTWPALRDEWSAILAGAAAGTSGSSAHAA